MATQEKVLKITWDETAQRSDGLFEGRLIDQDDMVFMSIRAAHYKDIETVVRAVNGLQLPIRSFEDRAGQ